MRRRLAGWLVLAWALSGCGMRPIEPPTPTPAIPTPVPATPTAIPSVVLLESSETSLLEAPLRAWSEARGWTFVRQRAAAAGEVRSASIVVVGSSAAGLGIQPTGLGVVVGDPAALPSSHLSTVGEPGARRDQASFLAGVLAGLASRFEAVALVEGTGGEHGDLHVAAFRQGLRYTCGRCRFLRLTPAEVTQDFFYVQGIDVAFALPGPATGDALAPIADYSLWAIWVVWVGEAPDGYPPDRLAAGVTFHPEALVVPALEGLLEGEAGMAWPYSVENGGLRVEVVSAEAITPGRNRLLEATLEQLADGTLNIGIDPITGEAR